MPEGTVRVWLELRVGGESFMRYGEGELDEAVAAADVAATRSPDRRIEVARCRFDGSETVLLRYEPFADGDAVLGPDAAG
jgi:hypothetical protein